VQRVCFSGVPCVCARVRVAFWKKQQIPTCRRSHKGWWCKSRCRWVGIPCRRSRSSSPCRVLSRRLAVARGMGCRWGPLSCPRLLLLLLLPQIPLCSNLVVAFLSSSVMRAQHVGQEAAWEPSFGECARIHSVLLREPTPCACCLFIYLFILLYYYKFVWGWVVGLSDVAICNVFWVWGDLLDRMTSTRFWIMWIVFS